MVAPFDLPDVCDILTTAIGGTVIQADVPCRQVPNAWQALTNRQDSGALGWTHWVDFNPDTLVDDNAVWEFPGGQSWQVGQALRFSYPDLLLILSVVFVEDRFTNTDRAYTRVYCNRYLRNI